MNLRKTKERKKYRRFSVDQTLQTREKYVLAVKCNYEISQQTNRQNETARTAGLKYCNICGWERILSRSFQQFSARMASGEQPGLLLLPFGCCYYQHVWGKVSWYALTYLCIHEHIRSHNYIPTLNQYTYLCIITGADTLKACGRTSRFHYMFSFFLS